MLFDFHMHTFLSDGALSPVELMRRAKVAGYTGLAVADHVGLGGLSRVLTELKADCALAEKHWGLKVLVGVELTHVPPGSIGDLARRARELGAEIIVVHGESPVEPVEPGTNLAAVSCPYVDILAHPGLLRPEEAAMAAANGIFLELSARGGHNAANGHVAQVGRAAGARFLVNSDAHEPGDLLSPAWAETVARGSGLDEAEARTCLHDNPLSLIERARTCANRTGEL